jgi:hypothetical protein
MLYIDIMNEIIYHLTRAIRLFKEEYPFEKGQARFAINSRSYDPILESENNYLINEYFNKINKKEIHPWKDLHLVVNQIEPMLKTLNKENSFFYIREYINKKAVITIFDADSITYERYLVEDEEELYENRFYESFIEKNNLIKKITDKESEDPIFLTLTNYYKFQPKN